MLQILVYGDSLTWGIVPGTRQRLPFNQRWPGVMERALLSAGHEVRVIEDCLNGRRTAWDDPFKPGRNGRIGIEQRIEVNSPLALVVLALGTNDFQSMHQLNAWHSAQGLATLVQAIRQAPIEPGMPVPGILIVSPPPIQEPKGPIAPKFEGARGKCAGGRRVFGRGRRIRVRVLRRGHCGQDKPDRWCAPRWRSARAPRLRDGGSDGTDARWR